MIGLRDIARRANRDYWRWRYTLAARQVLRTTPLAAGSSPFVLLSMVHSRDILSYLVAVKSFCARVAPQHIVVVCDPSISEKDRTLLRNHIPAIELRDAHEFQHPLLPRGGCWERLSALTEYARDAYVVQLDADTVTLGPIDDVSAAITKRHGFVLGEKADNPLSSLAETRALALPFLGPTAHVQDIAEATIDRIGLPADARYVRGCAGFTGFPPSPSLHPAMLDFSERMGKALGADWHKWGTEQITSNYLVANTPLAQALPFPKYGTPDQADDGASFLHFIGSMRFINNRYERVTRRTIDSLNTSAQ